MNDRDLHYVQIRSRGEDHEIGVYRGMSVGDLAACIAASYRLSLSDSEAIVGLRPEVLDDDECEARRQLVPLSHVVHQPEKYDVDEGCAYTLVYRAEPAPPPKPSWQEEVASHQHIVIAALVLVWLLLASVFPIIDPLTVCFRGFSHFWKSFFSPMLRNLYRNGPNANIWGTEFGFWEKAPLFEVCSRMTQVDASFWKNNATDCQKLYNDKEDSFLYFIECVVFLYVFARAALYALHRVTERYL